VIKKHGAAYFPGNRVGKRSRAVFFLTADKTLPPEKCNLPFNRIIGDHLDDAGPPAGFKKPPFETERESSFEIEYSPFVWSEFALSIKNVSRIMAVDKSVTAAR
jgi:hypothetical protein